MWLKPGGEAADCSVKVKAVRGKVTQPHSISMTEASADAMS